MRYFTNLFIASALTFIAIAGGVASATSTVADGGGSAVVLTNWHCC